MLVRWPVYILSFSKTLQLLHLKLCFCFQCCPQSLASVTRAIFTSLWNMAVKGAISRPRLVFNNWQRICQNFTTSRKMGPTSASSCHTMPRTQYLRYAWVAHKPSARSNTWPPTDDYINLHQSQGLPASVWCQQLGTGWFQPGLHLPPDNN